ncbi:hypothetical protein C8Q79DRAFT_920290 [Trametes meyenii]|nr:hypothetical protein C8Q79DRAFT_920290 [Trametes meyenii]
MSYGAQEVDMSTYLQSSPTDAFSVYSNPPSNSSDISAPVTPLSLPDAAGMYDAGAHDLAYPDGYDAAGYDAAAFGSPHGSAPDVSLSLGAGEHSYGADMQAHSGMEDMYRPKSAPAVGGWDIAMADDETPRASGNADRKLSSVGRFLAQQQLTDAAS